ncbi:hypothetical protein BZA05DRAFT_91665 [Tricharina praecox]|uniref:uncharacterized protein n=1 Tax=Tricharina praecox TaxID=43433 RepID=UPI00221EB4DE|nr:uncharacterized protein BZA05DRAFT_91665 [Tricharina praecox]KAI5848978.1 hypothetical protein BZA05DRAFT_91665 [Tricharina praecox]
MEHSHSPPPPPPPPAYYEEALEPFLPRDTTGAQAKERTTLNPRTKIFAALGGLTAILTLLFFFLPPTTLLGAHHVQDRSNATLHPIPVAGAVVGADNWTLPLPPLPLTPYAMALTCMAVQHRGSGAGHTHAHREYYSVDESFVDPAATTGEEERVLTYSLATTTSVVGLAESLLEVFTSYGLAASEGRRFVLDDADWAWGRWRDYFISGSLAADGAGREGALPCPRSASSLVVAHATRGWAFGHAFTEHFELARERGSRRQQRVFALARSGCEALLSVRPALAKRVRRRVAELRGRAGDGAWVVIQARRGDYKPRTWEWVKGEGVQLDVLADVAAEMSEGHGRVLVMSDDLAVVKAPELAGSLPAVEGGKGLIERGYTRSELLKLGTIERRHVAERWLEDILVVKELVGAGGADEGGVVCGGASATCRLLAVIVGWEMSVVNERWRDVDGGIGWSGVNW